jgi:predicted permease
VAAQGLRYFNEWRRVVSYYDGALAAVASAPGVRSAAVTNLLPFGEGRFDEDVARADAPGDKRRAEYRFVSPGYFSTLNIPIRTGRDFSPADGVNAPRVAILGASTAVRLFGATDPIGKLLVLRGKTQREVVGVVSDTHLFGFGITPPLQIYAPFPQADDVFWTGLQFVVRTEGDPLAVASSARERLLSIDRSLPPFNVLTIDSLLSRSLAPARMYASVLTAFAVLALLLACVGLYGLIAYLVAQRTQEFGIRLALGARAGDLGALVFREAARFVGIALLVGGAIALAGARLLSALLFGVTPSDWPTFAGVALLLIAVAVAASYAPARRAMRIDPMDALRAE